jgi:hypothetical protein
MSPTQGELTRLLLLHSTSCNIELMTKTVRQMIIIKFVLILKFRAIIEEKKAPSSSPGKLCWHWGCCWNMYVRFQTNTLHYDLDALDRTGQMIPCHDPHTLCQVDYRTFEGHKWTFRKDSRGTQYQECLEKAASKYKKNASHESQSTRHRSRTIGASKDIVEQLVEWYPTAFRRWVTTGQKWEGSQRSLKIETSILEEKKTIYASPWWDTLVCSRTIVKVLEELWDPF